MNDVWRTHTMVFVTFASCLVPYFFRFQLGKALTALWIFCVGYASLRAFAPLAWVNPRGLDPKFFINIQYGAAQSLVLLLLIPSLILALNERWRRSVGLGVSTLSVINTALVAIFGAFMMNAHTFNATVGAIGAIYLLRHGHPWIALIGVIGVFGIGGSTAILVLLAGLWGLGLHKKFSRAFQYILYGAMLVISVSFLRVKWGSSWHARMLNFEDAFRFWFYKCNHFFGIGPGAWEWTGPFLGVRSGETLLWLHNDYLQFLIEYGALGFTLALIVLFKSSFKAMGTPNQGPLLASLVAMLAYFPLHWSMSQVLICIIFVEVWDDQKTQGPFKGDLQIHR